MFKLTDKVALVTGASGGIGQEIALKLAEAGAKVVLTGRREDALKAVAAQIDGALVIPADLSDGESAAALVKEVEAQAGQLDILVNNAGLTRDNLSLRLKDEDWDAVMDVNLKAAFMLTRASLRGMMKRRFGRIVNISSIVGATGNPGQANYAASKAGLVAMGKSIAAEVANRGITINAIAPGFIATAMTEVLTDEQKAGLNARVPMGRMGAPNEIAAAVVFLASVEAGYITGETMHINGGMAML